MGSIIKKLLLLLILIGLTFTLYAQEDGNINTESDQSSIEQNNSSTSPYYDTTQEEEVREFFFFTFKSFSQEEKRYINDISNNTWTFFNSKKSIENKIEKINTLSQGIPASWREEAYKKNKMDFNYSYLLSGFGFGISNILMGDPLGFAFMGLDLITLTLPIMGLLNTEELISPWSVFFILFPAETLALTLVLDIFVYPMSGGKYSITGSIFQELAASEMRGFYIGSALVGLASFTGSLVCGICRSRNYNRQLATALNLDVKGKAVSLIPIADPVDSKLGLAFQIKL